MRGHDLCIQLPFSSVIKVVNPLSETLTLKLQFQAARAKLRLSLDFIKSYPRIYSSNRATREANVLEAGDVK